VTAEATLTTLVGESRPETSAWSRLRRTPAALRALAAGPALPIPISLVWVPLVLVLDHGAGIWSQRAIGVVTWLLLLALLSRESPLVRAQIAVVVVFATAVEYTFSPLLHVYIYRLDNVPAFVPPGHGLVYLCALAIGRSPWVVTRLRALVTATVVVGGAYAGWGLFVSDRLDVLGAFWFACLVGFLIWGRSRGLYVGAFLVVTYLELLGTWLGTWAWQPHDPTGIVAIGNPPSGAAGGYGWFDLAAVLAGPALLATVQRIRSR
jgi:FtsH-binding integral membrane protein